MRKKTPSQPEFGELFAPSQLRQVSTVSQITQTIKRLLESQLGRVWVTGEVTNCRAQSSGHVYFTLKDATAQLSCVLFRGEAASTRQFVQDGQKLILGGEITLYEPRGQYQLRVNSVELQGVGALQLAFEQLKRKLMAEGLFDGARKRPLPRYPQRIGLVTSPTGAAIRDVLHVIARRQPGLEILLAPARVQGQGAAEEIAKAIADLNGVHARGLRTLDLILVTRGGGSLEDLWAFNEEVVARAIFNSALPVVSAVGHEIDTSISDLVADLRAATPTAAAELITEGVYSSRQFIQGAAQRLRRLMQREMSDQVDRVRGLGMRLSRSSPRRRLEQASQRLDELRDSLRRGAMAQQQLRRQRWESLDSRLARLRPSRWLEAQRARIAELKRRARVEVMDATSGAKVSVAALQDKLRLLSPMNVLERGYSITREKKSGRILRSPEDVKRGDALITRFRDGEIESEVTRSAEREARD